MREARDTSYVGPALANTIRECDGTIPKPFEGHFGLRAEYGINKRSFYDFALLHTLGEHRLANASRNAIVTEVW